MIVRAAKASSYVGRFHRVRNLDMANKRFSAPFVLDRKRGTILPYVNEEWARGPGGILVPAIRGGAMMDLQHFPFAAWPAQTLNGSPAQQSQALDSAYVYNTSGDATGWRFMVQTAKTLTAAYFYLSASTGTAANINDINFELRNSTTGIKPQSTLHTSSNMDPNGDAAFVGWHKQDPADFALTAHTYYWAVIGDADGNSTDFATLIHSLSNITEGVFTNAILSHALSTTGFSTDPSANGNFPTIVLEFNDGTVLGSAFATSGQPTNNTERKGWRIGGLTEALSIWGMRTQLTDNDTNGIELYADATAPGGATIASGSTVILSSSGATTGVIFDAPVTFEKATPYRSVYTFGASAAIPRKLMIGAANGHSAVLRKAKTGDDSSYYAWANGTTDWANDDLDAVPQVFFIIADQIEVATSASATRLVGGGTLVG